MLGFNKFCRKLCFDKFSRLFCASYILRSSLFRIFLGNHFIKRNLHRKATGCHWRMMKLTRLGIVQGWVTDYVFSVHSSAVQPIYSGSGNTLVCKFKRRI